MVLDLALVCELVLGLSQVCELVLDLAQFCELVLGLALVCEFSSNSRVGVQYALYESVGETVLKGILGGGVERITSVWPCARG